MTIVHRRKANVCDRRCIGYGSAQGRKRHSKIGIGTEWTELFRVSSGFLIRKRTHNLCSRRKSSRVFAIRKTPISSRRKRTVGRSNPSRSDKGMGYGRSGSYRSGRYQNLNLQKHEPCKLNATYSRSTRFPSSSWVRTATRICSAEGAVPFMSLWRSL